MSIRFSVGKNTFDNRPVNHEVESFADFVRYVLNARSRKKGQTYITAPFNGDGTRKREGALPRAWLPFDFDRIADGETFAELCMYLSQYVGFAYTTASHTPDAPRARIILAADREMNREECRRVCLAIERDILAKFGDRVAMDGSVYRGEQPIYTPLIDAQSSVWMDGEIVDVDAVLRTAPELAQERTTEQRIDETALQDPVMRVLRERQMILKDLGGGRFGVVCPCADQHTSTSGDTSTVYMLPNFGGVKYGKFHCLHSHCENRPQDDFLRALELDPKAIWGTQAHGAVPPHMEDRKEASKRRPVLNTLSSFLADLRPIPWLVRNIVPSDSIIEFFGDPETWKSLIGLDLGLTIANRNSEGEWCGNRINKTGVVVYVCGEGAHGVRLRIKAWMERNGASFDDMLFFPTSRSVPVLDCEQIESLRDEIREKCNELGEENPALVIFDTLQRNFGDGDENSTQDMTRFIANLDRYIREPFKCAVLLIHHTGQLDKSRARGSSVLKSSVDVEFSFRRDEDTVSMECTKMKEGSRPIPIGFNKHSHVLNDVYNDEGDNETAPVVLTTAPPKRYKPLGKAQQGVLDIIKELSGNQPGYKVAKKRLHREFIERQFHRNSFVAAIAALKGRKILQDNDLEIWIEP